MILESTIILDFGLDEMYNKYLCFYLIALTFKSLLFMLITLLQNYFISCYSSKLLQGRILFSSVAQSCLTLCHPMDCSMPGFPVHHQLPEFVQTHVHRVSDAIQPSHPLLSPSPAFNLPQHQGLFQ